MVPRHFYLFVIMARIMDLGKVRKGYAFRLRVAV